ncbi:MAG: hypothetical protein KC766_06430, partial [Myxococcales bacterium]|nr:hypothetical protein [Myxococcales bacterium]
MAVTVSVEFFSRRQNTNQGDDQFRIWCPRSEADKIAQHIPQLRGSIQANATWSQPVDVSWSNGQAPEKLSFGAYAGQSGEMSFTASRKTLLFNFAAKRHQAGTEGDAIGGTCTIDNGTIVAVV